MYGILSELLADRTGGVTFSCFGVWHLCYLLLAIAILSFAVARACKATPEQRRRIAQRFLHTAFILYIADFFLMPFAYGEIDVEKLPFHLCTAMCVLSFMSHRNTFLGKYRSQFALYGLLSNLIYLIYPAGLMWYAVHPLSYRVLQTLLFHGSMAGYGLLVLLFDQTTAEQTSWRRDLLVIVCMTLWALLGNFLYTGEAWGHTQFINWFFVLRDPFYLLPQELGVFVMPPLNVLLFFSAARLVRFIRSH